MKRILLTVILFVVIGIGAQPSAKTAVSKSNAFEYESQYTKAMNALTELKKCRRKKHVQRTLECNAQSEEAKNLMKKL